MSFGPRYLLQKGNLTADNRDTSGWIERNGIKLYLLADGSTSKPGSGELAHALLHNLKTGFQQQSIDPLSSAEQIETLLLQLLRKTHSDLAHQWPQAACSYLLLAVLPDTALSIHEGDCCLGSLQEGAIEWLTQPHCRANWQGTMSHTDLAQHPDRHTLTRCFSARRALDPQLNRWPNATGRQWLLATDGFWAELPHSIQQECLNTSQLPSESDDDISCLIISSID